jgi:hypothetical protein
VNSASYNPPLICMTGPNDGHAGEGLSCLKEAETCLYCFQLLRQDYSTCSVQLGGSHHQDDAHAGCSEAIRKRCIPLGMEAAQLPLALAPAALTHLPDLANAVLDLLVVEAFGTSCIQSRNRVSSAFPPRTGL